MIMGLFDFFRKNTGNKSLQKDTGNESDDSDQMLLETLAFTEWKFNEYNGDYDAVRKSLNEIKLSEAQKDAAIERLKLLHQIRLQEGLFESTLKKVQEYLNAGEKSEAFSLAFDAYKQDVANMKLLELLMQVFGLYNNENDILGLFDELSQSHIEQKYNIEYRKALYLKSISRFKEAKLIFESLNNEFEFAWNYYQMAIIENVMGETASCLEYLKKAFEFDPRLKEDAKRFPELANLRDEQQFIALMN
jgi:tetratricopeptide (TPR) repeat protein